MLSIAMPVQVSQVIEDWKYRTRKSDKQIQIDLSFSSAPHLSKAKSGVRPFCLHRFFGAIKENGLTKADALAFVDAIRAAIEGDGEPVPSAPDPRMDRDLVLAVLTKLDEVARAVGVKKPAKVEALAEERRTA